MTQTQTLRIDGHGFTGTVTLSQNGYYLLDIVGLDINGRCSANLPVEWGVHPTLHDALVRFEEVTAAAA